MKKIFACLALAIILFGCTMPWDAQPVSQKTNTSTEFSLVNETVTVGNFTSEGFTVANWNLQIFGIKKSGNTTLMRAYSNEMKKYDIIFVQEIRDSSQTVFPKLCALMNGYNCNISTRAGRTLSTEQYGVIYKKGIEIINSTDYNPDAQNRWERPPWAVTFKYRDYVFTVFDIHTKPDDAKNEIDAVEEIAQGPGNRMIIGDLNADCDYYTRTIGGSWNWEVPDSEDTTTGSTDCAYDRILTNDDMHNEFNKYGRGSGVGSDHYLIWGEFNP